MLLERGNGYLALNLKRESPTRAFSAGSTPSTHAILYTGPGPMIHRVLLVMAIQCRTAGCTLLPGTHTGISHWHGVDTLTTQLEVELLRHGWQPRCGKSCMYWTDF